MHRRSILLLGVILTLVSTVAGSAATRGSAASTPAAPPGTDPGNFSDPVANPYYPLVPGTTSIFRGTKEGQSFTTRVTVTARTKVIQGVTTTVVHDVVRHGADLLEETLDWYASDNDGNVWYFGEATTSYEPGGQVSTEGSWQAGVDGAVPGIIMRADPHASVAYRQEYYQGHAEDQAWVVDRGGTLSVPYGTVDHLLRTFEWTRLEPDVVDEKDYAPGLGIVLEVAKSGGREVGKLVRVIHT